MKTLSSLFTDSSVFLELLNGGAITPELIWLVLLTIYLTKEARRRDLHPFNWWNLPPSMNFVMAIFICDLGVSIRSLTVWIWRRFFDAGDFSPLQHAFLVIGAALIAMGFLCKIRALTEPDHGDGPWLAASFTAALMIVVLMVAR